MWIPNQGVKTTNILYYREGWTRQQDQWLLPAVWGPLQWNELAKETERWVSTASTTRQSDVLLGFQRPQLDGGGCASSWTRARIIYSTSTSEHRADLDTFVDDHRALALGRHLPRKVFLHAPFDFIWLESSVEDFQNVVFWYLDVENKRKGEKARLWALRMVHLSRKFSQLDCSFTSSPALKTLVSPFYRCSSGFRLYCNHFIGSGIICHIRRIVAHHLVPLRCLASRAEITHLKHFYRAVPEGFSAPGFH